MSNATPMGEERRALAYRRQIWPSARTTPRQRRRAQHKRNHAFAPFGKRADRG